jgi:hypothetical protein
MDEDELEGSNPASVRAKYPTPAFIDELFGRGRRRRIRDESVTGNTGQYDQLAAFQDTQRRLRATEGREMDRLVRLAEGAPDELRGEQRTATNEMRRQAALRMGAGGARGNIIGAGSAAKAVGQEAANIGTQFGAQIRQAARQAAQARLERSQQAIESMAKPGVDVERVSVELRNIVDRNSRSLSSRLTKGLIGKGATPVALANELAALENTTEDPLAIQQIQQLRANIEQGRNPFEGMAQA